MQSIKQLSVRTRVLTGGVALAALGAVTFGTVSANADSPAAGGSSVQSAAAKGGPSKQELRQSDHLTVAAATEAAQAALDAAEQADQRVAVSVVDRDGNTIVTLRGDGAGPQAPESAERKAFTSVAWNAPTSELTERLKQTPNLKDIPGTLFLAGGAPVTAKDAPVAGIGVAGAPSGTLDEKFARAGVAALGR